MKITVFYPHLEAQGGAEKHASKVVQHLSKQHQVVVYGVLGERGIGAPEWWKGLAIKEAWKRLRTPVLRKTVNELLFIFKTTAIEKDNDLFIGFGSQGVTVAGGIGKRIQTIGYFFHPNYALYPRDVDRDSPLISRLIFRQPPFSCILKSFDRDKVNRVRVLAANSPIVARIIHRIYRRRAHVMMPGVDVRPLAKEKPGKQYIFIPTRVVYHKNLHTAIKALHILREQLSKDVELIISGAIDDQAYWRQIQAMIHSLKLNNCVKHIGFVSEQHLFSLYRNAVCHWLISYSEDFGLTVLESMSQETAVIASNDGGAKYTVVDSETGYLVDPNNADSFAKKTAFLLENPDICREMGKRGRNHVLKNFTWEKHFKDWDGLLEIATAY